ncbi:MAG: hypothetical protein AB1625_04210 [Acidobacteriota bacterium]
MNARVPLLVAISLAVLGWGETASTAEFGWPVEIESDQAVVVVYQPQPEAMQGNTIAARTAVAVRPRDGREPAFGVVWATATLDIDRDARTARVVSVDVTRVRFPETTPEEEKRLARLLEAEVPTWELEMSLDQLAASLETAEKEQAYAGELRNDAPRVIFSAEPAILVTLDGDPQLREIEGSSLQRLVNTAFPIVYDPASGAYYLYGTTVWFTAPDIVKGPWKAVEKAPEAVANLFGDAQETLDGAEKPEGDPEELKRTRIVVSTTPAELIVADGAPKFEPIGDGNLLALGNSESNVFLEIASQSYYTVLSGRWYRSPSLEKGPWTHVAPEDLPTAFASIAPDSERGEIRAHVAGTQEAEDAVADAYVPQTSAIKRKDAAIEVVYDGAPKFSRIEGTEIEFAVNTGTQVLRSGALYYACEQGVWYVANSPTGPWSVADERPSGVEDIPPSSPVYNTRYVYIYDSTPEVVYVGYLPGYLGCFPYRGTVVYGTGWYYPGWIGPRYYYPRLSTWGFHVHYHPWSGWGFGMSWSSGWYRMSWGWVGGGWYGPGWGGSWHSGWRSGWNAGYWAGWHAANNWYGPGGYRPSQVNPGGVNVTRPGARPLRPVTRENIYSRPQNQNKMATRDMIAKYPPRPAVARPVTRPAPGPAARPQPGASTRPAARPGSPGTPSSRPATLPSKRPRPAPGTPNDVLADPDGNVYRKTPEGWETRNKGGWTKTEIPAARPSTANPTARPAARPGGAPTTRPSISQEWGARVKGQTKMQSTNRATVPRGSAPRRSSVPPTRR